MLLTNKQCSTEDVSLSLGAVLIRNRALTAESTTTASGHLHAKVGHWVVKGLGDTGSEPGSTDS